VPALLKGFFEQVFRPGFALKPGKRTLMPGQLTGKSARVIVTMGMPAIIYRWYFMAHSLMSLERNILRFVGLKPIRHSIIGSVEASAAAREKWLDRIRLFAREAI
jgi:putative NADPH-quinone reductase